MSRRPAGLSAEDAALWRAVTKDMQPLHPRRSVAVAPAAAPAARPATRPVPAPPVRPTPVAGALGAPPASTGLDRRTATRLRRGRLDIDGRLDLHGLTQAEAHHALTEQVRSAHAAGRRVLLVVTGKGFRDGTGVLRAAVPRWLDEPPLRNLVLSAVPARPGDGGAGALYVLVRRRRA